jgi:histidine ammonia-lyase/phenylalanine ammonia-lyase
VLGNDTLTTADVAWGARAPQQDVRTRIDGEAAARMAASVASRDKLIATHRPIYGVTTGFGDNGQFHIGPAKTAELQRNLITYHLNGTGPTASEDTVRATMLVRANCLARGYSGIRQEVVELILACLRAGVMPAIPERGSVGASGDLVPLCYLGNLLIGEGDAVVAGRTVPARQALAEHGLTPVVLEPKEGLALINGTSFMCGFGVLAARDAADLAVIADLCTAFTSEALLGNRGHFDPFIHRQKPHPGQVRSAARIRALLSGSRLATDQPQVLDPDPEIGRRGVSHLERIVQDRYSVRCAPHVTGVLDDTLEWAVRWLDVEINSTNDNPLFDPSGENVPSGGNFYGGHVGQAMDSLKSAVANVGDLLDRQLALMVDTKFNHGLTPNLAPPVDGNDPEAVLYHGFKGMQIAASALAAEALKNTMPATVFSRSTESHNQDKVSMGTIAARDARNSVELVREIAAIHLLAACQAVELRGSEGLGQGTAAAFALIREHVAFADRDRRMDGDVAAIVELIRTGELVRLVEEHAGPAHSAA